MQDEAGFRQSLKRAGKKAHVIDGLIAQVLEFEKFLSDSGQAGIEAAKVKHVQDYIGTLAYANAKKRVRGLALYFRYRGQQKLTKAVAEFREREIAKTRKVLKLSELLGVDPLDLGRLTEIGIRTTEQLIAAARTPAARTQLAHKTGIANAKLLELVKLADLSRLWSVKSVRTRLYYDAGLDTPDKFTTWEPAALRAMLVDFVARSGFDGIAPLPKEIRLTIEQARKLPPAVEY